MNTLEKLQEALEHVKKAEDLIRQAKNENVSLETYYGYSIEMIAQQLNKYGDASVYRDRNIGSLKEIVEAEGEKWSNDMRLDRNLSKGQK
jgi:hypothetical protein